VKLSVRRVAALPEFEALHGRWSQLAEAADQRSPFLSHDWFACCWRACAPASRPEALVVEDGGGPVAVVPLMRWAEKIRGLPVRTLGFLESPDTPFADLVAVAPMSAVVEAVLDHLRARRDWDVLRLRRLRPGSPALKAFEEALAGRFAWQLGDTVRSPYLETIGDWTAFYRATSQRFKKTARHIRNRLERAGRVTIEEYQAIDPASPLFAEVLDLTGRSWKADRRLAIATMPGMRDFFSELTQRASERGWLSLWILRLDDRAVAMEYQIVDGGTVRALRADFDVATRELSPGSALNYAIVETLFARASVHEYDMGPGLNEYKMRWASGVRETVALTAFRPGPYGRALAVVETALVPAARRLAEVWR
jgi:CelD/BcsL family acetyltransferase involved in cellulose biosynthesis